MRLQNKVAIITGAASGMGKAEALRFASEGAKVIVADLNMEGAEAVVAEIKENNGEALAVKVNVTEQADLENMVKAAMDHYGQIDVVINNAGIFDKYTNSLETTEQQWDLIFDINVKAIYKITNLVLPNMIKRGEGTIVNIASIAGLVAQMGGAAYTASKHAVVGYTKHIAAVYGSKGIKMNAIAPGTIRTPLTADMLKTRPTNKIPLDRFGNDYEVADLAVFLASDESKFMNGAVVPIDGGYTIV
ncbi:MULTISPECIES: SDR family NAD(P)-dependent oxidoreductase [Cytobacillus]|uniref:SDR family NAD(P)-dependent oxidoreductase n=1 Tax=Cytobacillus TaxID=2675230 RepID=UPI001CD70804|nr:glucose 1-dehydrogenase [Cytobacillus kochii]MCA1025582.1 glucose 1-dehydrogenase [Cytobacillus kochii]MCM3320684.1 glucose 1-dehydrogenase [Cytobacillus kochii]MCM3344482.1 glucose 1-dehydrogenase [Cytobacillus kochii]MDM5208326.1 glucose 1-dehydrogenase [Cytobacillus kochii]